MNIILKKLLALIILFIVGIGCLLLGLQGDDIGENFELLFAGVLGVGFSVFIGVKMLFTYIKDPKNFLLNQEKEDDENKKNEIVKFINKSVQKERNLFFFIFKNPLIWGLYLCSFLLIIIFFYFEFYLKNYIVLDFLNFFGFQPSNIIFFIGFTFFFYSFITLSILLIPYLILGELYQKRIKGSSSNIIFQIIIDFIYAVPYLIIWSFLWVIFMLSATKEKNRINTLKSLSILVIISAFSYWTYYSLAKIAFDDKRTLFPAKGPITFYKKNWKGVLSIWVRSGFYFTIPLGIYILVFTINIILSSFSLVSEEATKVLFDYSTFYLGIPSMIIAILGSIISTQLNLLNYTIKESEGRSEDFVLDLK